MHPIRFYYANSYHTRAPNRLASVNSPPPGFLENWNVQNAPAAGVPHGSIAVVFPVYRAVFAVPIASKTLTLADQGPVSAMLSPPHLALKLHCADPASPLEVHMKLAQIALPFHASGIQ